MAIRFGKNMLNSSSTEENNKSSIGVTGKEGKTYDLDALVESRDRNSTTSLTIQRLAGVTPEELGNSRPANCRGDLVYGTKEQPVPMGNPDYKKYLFTKCPEPSTQGYVPTITTRKPNIVWTDETLDDVNTTPKFSSTVYAELAKLDEVYQNINDNIKLLLAKDGAEIFENIEAVSQLIGQINETLKNKEIITEITEDNISDSTIPTTKAIEQRYLNPSNVVFTEYQDHSTAWEGYVIGKTHYSDNIEVTENDAGYYTGTLNGSAYDVAPNEAGYYTLIFNSESEDGQ